MNNSFLSIKDAAQQYGKAEITIRRLVRSLTKDGRNRDRKYVNPDVVEVKELRKKQKAFAYAISREFLERLYGLSGETPVIQNKEQQTETSIAIESLRDQLHVKDEQIRALNQTLESLSERQRETNILMKGLQEKLLIEPPKRRWWRLWRRG